MNREHAFWLRVWPRGDCWEFRGAAIPRGYKPFHWLAVLGDGYAHRHAYELAKGMIPPGLTVDHLCRHPWCVKPSHLEAVTQAVNNARGFGPTAMNKRQQVAKCGHPLVASWGGRRRCMTCYQAYRHTYMKQYRKRNAQ